MDSDRWQKLKALFSEAAELPEAERRDFIERGCKGDEALRAEALALLDADLEASGFLEGQALDGFSVGQRRGLVGRRFGSYEAVREIGRGGMGVVLLGERADGRYRGKVAIKVVQTSLLPEGMADRFRAEGQILATLDHPNIARLLDAGDTDEGLSYLIMEYVDGPRIDEHADRNLLDVPGRLRLFRSVLEGVDYAHARGVVHRDLKPSNILVSEDGTPKLVDFGIAKLLRAPSGYEMTVPVTRTALRMMTPEYASPEQVKGLDVDAASDVYSLGVVLYRLLTGRAPYELDTTRPGVAEHVIAEQRPERPSDVLTRPLGTGESANTTTPTDPDLLARNRSSTLDRLRRVLRGDLDTIVLKALGKEPEQRYRTAGAFADNITRHLERQPIRAREQSRIYWALRFARRRRKSLAAAGVILVGLVSTVWQTTVARAERENAAANSEELADLASSVIRTFNLGQQEEVGATQAKEQAVQTALNSLNDLMARVEGEPSPDLLYKLAQGYSEIGLVQGYPYGANLGKFDEAFESMGRSLELSTELVERAPEFSNARSALAIQRNNYADMFMFSGQVDSATVLYRTSEAEFEALLEEAPGDPYALDGLAVSLQRLGVVHESRRELDETVAYFQRARDVELEFAAVTTDNRVSALADVASTSGNLSRLHGLRGTPREGIQEARDGLRLVDSLLVENPTPRVNIIKASLLAEIALRHVEAGSPGEAVAYAQSSVEIARALAETDPSNVQFSQQIANGVLLEGLAHWWAGNPVVAQERAQEALDRIGPVPEGALGSVGMFVNVGLRVLADGFTAAGNYPAAREALDRATTQARQILEWQNNLGAPGLAYREMASTHLATAYLERARAAAGEAEACEAARIAADSADFYYGAAVEVGVVAPGEQATWARYQARIPSGGCTP